MINLKNLNYHLENLSESNRCFNDEEKLGLQYGMINLEDKITKEIYLWGKIEGIKDDYYIAYYLNYDNLFPKKIFYYCNNDYEFHEIKKGNDTLIKKIEKKTPFILFSGFPNSVYSMDCRTSINKEKSNDDGDNGKSDDWNSSSGSDSDDSSDDSNDKGSGSDSGSGNGNGNGNGSESESESESESGNDSGSEKRENAEDEDKKRKNEKSESEKKSGEKKKKKKKYDKQNVIELERLSYVVSKIDEETFIIPYNSVKITNNLEVKFSNFSGLSILDALKLSSWVHFRYPKNLTYEKIKNCDTFFLNNFLDNIKSDNPTVMWNIRINEELNKISILNYLYPGYVFYHILNTPFYASLYIGNGIPNSDLPFLLP